MSSRAACFEFTWLLKSHSAMQLTQSWWNEGATAARIPKMKKINSQVLLLSETSEDVLVVAVLLEHFAFTKKEKKKNNHWRPLSYLWFTSTQGFAIDLPFNQPQTLEVWKSNQNKKKITKKRRRKSLIVCLNVNEKLQFFAEINPKNLEKILCEAS